MTFNIERPAPGISIYKNAFEAKYFVSAIEDECNKENNKIIYWEDAGTGAGNVSEYRTSINCNLQAIMDPNFNGEFKKGFKIHIQDPFKKCMWDYAEEYDLHSTVHEAYQVLKYTEGAYYRNHYDSGGNNQRTFSLVASLQEAEEGGELEFPLFNFKYKASAGDIIFFPSCFPYTHIAHPVISGVKYSIVTWFI